MQIKSFEELVNKVNIDLGDFCAVFAQKRKELANLKKCPNKALLFIYKNDERDWAINEGGGTEIQYHIYMRDAEIGYGLGFNMQYVPYKNDKTPIGFMKPYCDAFLYYLRNNDDNLKNYSFEYIYGNQDLLEKPQNGEYVLYGKRFSINNNEIDDNDYSLLLNNLKGILFKIYMQVFILKNGKEILSIKGLEMIEKCKNLLLEKHNIILQGAPGTGKTYNTAAIALATLGITDVNFDDHETVMKLYEEMRYDKEKNPNGQIAFCTFHQTMDYEDFVEGIKIQKDENDNVSYNVEDGIFKRISDKAKSNLELSKKNSNELETEIRTREVFDGFCEDIQSKLNETDFVELKPESKMKIRKVSFKSDGTALSIGLAKDENSGYQTLTWEIVSRDYDDFKSNKIKSYADIKPRYESKASFHGNAIYYYSLYQRMYEFEKQYFSNEIQPTSITEKNFVLIIDEINRGNVSKIFGELITLLESDKRIGSEHPIIVTLPYSKESFGIPSNLYIIGTMNTTDRSTGTLDYALRRRFAFVTLKSDVSIIGKHYDKLGNEELKNIAVSLFNDVRNFIDNPKHLCGDLGIDDLMVGHSYFMAETKEELANRIEFEVIPLISEYINDGILNVKHTERDNAFTSWANLDVIKATKEEDESSETGDFDEMNEDF